MNFRYFRLTTRILAINIARSRAHQSTRPALDFLGSVGEVTPARNLEDKQMRFPALVFSTLLLATMVATTPASASCSPATLKGVYGYYHGRPGGGATITAVLGQMTSDGAGNLSGSWTMSVNGAITFGSFDGVYTIAANCTGTLTFATEDTTPAHFNIFLDDTHKGFQMIQTDPGFAQPGFGMAQGTTPCGLSGAAQTLATNFLGTLFPTLDIEAVAGQLKLNGLGNITGGSETFSVAGTITVSPVAGSTYTEQNNCQGTAQIISALGTMNFRTVVVNSGKEWMMLEDDNNTLVAGTAQE